MYVSTSTSNFVNVLSFESRFTLESFLFIKTSFFGRYNYGCKSPKMVYLRDASEILIYDITSASERTCPVFCSDFFVCWTPSKKFALVHKNSLASCQLVSSQRPVTHSDVSFQTKPEWSHCLVTIELTTHISTPLRDTLCFFKVVCSPSSRSRRITGIRSIEAPFRRQKGHYFSMTKTLSRTPHAVCVCVRIHTHDTYTSTPCNKWGDTSLAQTNPSRWKRVPTIDHMENPRFHLSSTWACNGS